MCLSTETLRSQPRTGKKEKSRGAMECGLGPSTSYYYYYYHWKVLVGNRPHGKVNYLGWAEYVALGAAGWLAVAQSVSLAVLQRTATYGGSRELGRNYSGWKNVLDNNNSSPPFMGTSKWVKHKWGSALGTGPRDVWVSLLLLLSYISRVKHSQRQIDLN